MPQLDISTFIPQLFWLFVSFSLLYLLLSKLCLPRLSRIFAARDDVITQNLKAAHEAKDEAARLKIEYEDILTQAVIKKSEMLAETTKNLAIIMDEKLAVFDQELEALMQESDVKIQDFEAKMTSEIDHIAKEATILILKELGDISPKEELITQTINEVKHAI